MQFSRDGAKPSCCKSPSGEILNVLDIGKSSELGDKGLHMERQVDKERHKVLSPKTTPICHNSSKVSQSTQPGRCMDHHRHAADGRYTPHKGSHVQIFTQPSSCKPPPGSVPNVQDTVKLSNPVATRLHIESKPGKESCKVLDSKTIPVSHSSNKSCLGVKFRDMHTTNTKNTLDM